MNIIYCRLTKMNSRKVSVQHLSKICNSIIKEKFIFIQYLKPRSPQWLDIAHSETIIKCSRKFQNTIINRGIIFSKY